MDTLRPPPAVDDRATLGRLPEGATLAALLVVAAVLLSGLGSTAGGTHPDEGLYLEAGREMHARGEWLTPTVDGRPDFTKPPLLYWAMGGSFSVLGTSLFAARLPVALAALALAWVTGRLARREVGPAAEPVAILLLGTCLGLLRYARVDLMDVPLALAIAVGLGAIWRVASGGPPALALIAGVGAAAAALLKGPVGPLLMVAPAAVYLGRRRMLRSRLPWLLGAVALALLLAAPWYVAMAQRYGTAFVGRFFGIENVGKFRFPWTLEGELELLVALPVLLLPWTPLVRLRGPAAGLAWPWVLGLLFLYSLPGLKHPHYVVPALAPLALLACCAAGGRTAVDQRRGAARARRGRSARAPVPAAGAGPARAGGCGAAGRPGGDGGGPGGAAGRSDRAGRRSRPPLRHRLARSGAPADSGLGGHERRRPPDVHRHAEPGALLVPGGNSGAQGVRAGRSARSARGRAGPARHPGRARAPPSRGPSAAAPARALAAPAWTPHRAARWWTPGGMPT